MGPPMDMNGDPATHFSSRKGQEWAGTDDNPLPFHPPYHPAAARLRMDDLNEKRDGKLCSQTCGYIPGTIDPVLTPC